MANHLGVATSLVENIMASVEESVSPDENNGELIGGDPEKDNHILSVLANLLFAYDGISEKVHSFLDRLQIIAKNCNQNCTSLRDKLYKNMEDCFYFFNDFVDIPVLSGEQ